MAVDNYIQELLYKIDEIPVEGLGTFLSYESPARINQENQSVEPPKKSVRFSPEIKGEQHYLISLVSERENASRQQAIEIIEEFVHDIRREVKHSFGYTIDGVGTFIEGNNEDLRFIPDPQANFNLETYGLTEVPLPAKNRTESVGSESFESKSSSTNEMPSITSPFSSASSSVVSSVSGLTGISDKDRYSSEPVSDFVNEKTNREKAEVSKETKEKEYAFEGNTNVEDESRNAFAGLDRSDSVVNEFADLDDDSFNDPVSTFKEEPVEETRSTLENIVEEKKVNLPVYEEPAYQEPVYQPSNIEEPIYEVPDIEETVKPSLSQTTSTNLEDDISTNLEDDIVEKTPANQISEPIVEAPILEETKEKRTVDAILEENMGNVAEDERESLPDPQQPEVESGGSSFGYWAVRLAPFLVIGLFAMMIFKIKQHEKSITTAETDRIGTVSETIATDNETVSTASSAESQTAETVGIEETPSTQVERTQAETGTTDSNDNNNNNNNAETVEQPVETRSNLNTGSTTAATNSRKNNTNTNRGTTGADATQSGKIVGSTKIQTQRSIPGGYYGVTNVFREAPNAQKHVRKLNNSGYSAFVVKHEGSYRSAVFLSKNKLEAKSALQNVKRNVNKDAWLMIN